MRLFHLVERRAWTALAPGARWQPPSLAREGCVHLSHAEQLAGTLAAHFARATALFLLELDPRGLGAALVLEAVPTRGGERFPHLHRAFAQDEVLRHWTLERAPEPHGAAAASRWSLPRLAALAERDRPPGSPGAPG